MTNDHPLLYWCLQPLLLVSVLTLWLTDPTREESYLLTIVGVQVILGVIEHYFPARPTWTTRAKEKVRNVLFVFVLSIIAVIIGEFYRDVLSHPLANFRQSLGLDIWPHDWPLLAQLFLVFFTSEFIWYWMHRAEHRWKIVWRLSGHGAHHAFKKLGALNFGLNHPAEYFLILLPSLLVELIFGVGAAAAGAAIFTVTQTSIVHANIAMNSRGIGWLFTTNKHHICHHSSVLEESNMNYGCSAIVWDRVFMTFLNRTVEDAGTGPTEPTMWQKFLMPVKEPDDTSIAPGGHSA